MTDAYSGPKLVSTTLLLVFTVRVTQKINKQTNKQTNKQNDDPKVRKGSPWSTRSSVVERKERVQQISLESLNTSGRSQLIVLIEAEAQIQAGFQNLDQLVSVLSKRLDTIERNVRLSRLT